MDKFAPNRIAYWVARIILFLVASAGIFAGLLIHLVTNQSQADLYAGTTLALIGAILLFALLYDLLRGKKLKLTIDDKEIVVTGYSKTDRVLLQSINEVIDSNDCILLNSEDESIRIDDFFFSSIERRRYFLDLVRRRVEELGQAETD